MKPLLCATFFAPALIGFLLIAREYLLISEHNPPASSFCIIFAALI